MLPLGSARAEGWAPGAGELPVARGGAARGSGAAVVGYAAGMVPPFRAGSRDRAAFGADADAWFAERVRVGIAWDWLLDRHPSEAVISGPGDFRLDTTVCVWRTDALSTGVGWQAKLPNARNEDELGTDETDVDFGAWLGLRGGPWQGVLSLGLGVLGNPLRFADQDDVPRARLEGSWSSERVRTALFAELRVGTTRNPVRAEAGGRVRYGRGVFAELEGGAGLTPAAADGRVTVRLGYAWALPTRGAGE